jgi:membrane protein required for colicin V production
MNLLDLGIIVLLLLVTVRGYFRGLFQELAVLLGLVGGFLVAARTYTSVAAILQPLVKSSQWAQGIAFVLVLVAFYWGVRLLAYVLQRLLYHLYLDIFDKLFGAFFALVKGCLILGFVVLILGVVLPKNTKLVQESFAAPLLSQVARRALDFLPPEFKERFQEYLKKIPKPKEKGPAEVSNPWEPPSSLPPPQSL